MRPTSQNLALRDPALASLIGAVGAKGSNFGNDGVGYFGFAGDVGFAGDTAGFGGFRPPPGPQLGGLPPHAEHAVRQAHGRMQHMEREYARAMEWHNRRLAHTQGRQGLLNPNAHSEVKVERYDFSLSQPGITSGTSSAISITGSPDTDLRPQRVITNAPTVNFVYLSLIKVANVVVFVGPGVSDAFTYSALAVGSVLDMPTLTPANRATVVGEYTGLEPAPYTSTVFTFCLTLQGPASVAGSAACGY